jgi:hypothetical protein
MCQMLAGHGKIRLRIGEGLTQYDQSAGPAGELSRATHRSRGRLAQGQFSVFSNRGKCL